MDHNSVSGGAWNPSGSSCPKCGMWVGYNQTHNCGYTCFSCGQYVQNGTIHNCGGSTAPHPPPSPPKFIFPLTNEERLLTILERIAAALERFVDWETPSP